MGAGFHDAASLDHMDAVGVAHGGQAVGDHQGGAALHQPFEGGLDEGLALGVEGAGGLVEQQDGGVLEEGAGNGDTLTLAAGQAQARLAGAGRIAFGQGGDEVMGGSGGGGGLDLGPRRTGAAVGDVGGYGVVEQEGFLGHQGDP